MFIKINEHLNEFINISCIKRIEQNGCELTFYYLDECDTNGIYVRYFNSDSEALDFIKKLNRKTTKLEDVFLK